MCEFFGCDYCVLLTVNMLCYEEVMFIQLLNFIERYYKLYYHLVIFIELNFSNFRPLTCFSVMIPEAV